MPPPHYYAMRAGDAQCYVADGSIAHFAYNKGRSNNAVGDIFLTVRLKIYFYLM